MGQVTLCTKYLTLSAGYQVTIPLEIRTALKLEPGHRIQAIRQDDTIKLIPVKPMIEYRGIAKGIDTTVDREPDRL